MSHTYKPCCSSWVVCKKRLLPTAAMSSGVLSLARAVFRLQIPLSTQIYTSTRTEKPGSPSWVWLEQARVNRRVLHNLADSLSFHPEASFHACFLSQQVAELSLKAARLSLDPRFHCRDHKLLPNAQHLEKHHFFPKGFLLEAIKPLDNYYIRTRYPNCYKNKVVPARAFNTSQAIDAIEKADKVYQQVKNFMKSF